MSSLMMILPLDMLLTGRQLEGGVQQSKEILNARPIVSEASEQEKDPAISS